MRWRAYRRWHQVKMRMACEGHAFGMGGSRSGLKMESATADEYFSGDVVRQRGAEEEDCVCGFFGGSEAAERAASEQGFQPDRRDADLDVVTGDVEYGAARGGGGNDESRLNKAEADGVHVDVVTA